MTNGHAPHSPYRPHTLVGEASNGGSAAGIHLGQSSRHHNMRQGGRGGASHHSAAASRNQESRSRHHHTPSSVSGSQVPIQASEGWEIRDNGDALSHHSVPAWPTRTTNPRLDFKRFFYIDPKNDIFSEVLLLHQHKVTFYSALAS